MTRHLLAYTVALSLFAAINAHSIGHKHLRRDLSTTTSLPSGWTYSGCYTDSVSARVLPLDSYRDDDMTEGKCINYCIGNGYSYAGVEYSRECFCGYQIASTSSKVSESDCSMACAGADSEACGGPDRINIFTNGKGAAVANTNPGDSTWSYLGCYSDTVSARSLECTKPFANGVASVSNCVQSCIANGYSYAGVEFGQECWCGNSIQGSGSKIDSSACNMPCTGSRSDTCGGRDALNLYAAGCGAPLCSTNSFPHSNGYNYNKVKGYCGLFVHQYYIWQSRSYDSSLSDCQALSKCSDFAASQAADSFTTYKGVWEQGRYWHCDIGFDNKRRPLTYTTETQTVYNSYFYTT